MLKYIIKRILASIATIIGIIFLINLFIELAPGDPGRLILGMNASPEQVQILNHSLGYDQPFLKRFFEYIIGVFTRLDLGTSYKYGVSVWEKICSRIPTTFIVALTTVVIDSILSVFLGIVCVKNKDSKIDAVISTVAGFTSAIPSYWLGVVLLLIFCFKLRFFSVYDMGNSVAGYVLPVATVVIITFGPLVKKTRGVPKYFAMAIGQLLFDCIDKGVCLLLVYLIIRSLPDRFLIKLPYGKYVTRKQYREEDIDFGEE